jgi:hypothetical protein
MWQRTKGPKDCFPPAAIGKRNRERQHALAMEKRFVTTNVSYRLFTSILGITFTAAYCFFEYFVNPYAGTFFEFVHELCYDGMVNELDDVLTPRSGPTTPAGQRVPGAPSPLGSPAGGAPASHTVCRVSDIPDWTGAPQPKCSICKKHTTRCCSRCSRATINRIFPLCNPTKRPCNATHAADPFNPIYKHRISTGLTGKRKHKRPSTRPPARQHHPAGSRSGGATSFDPRRFQKRPSMGGEDEDEGSEDEEEDGDDDEEEEEDE